MAGYVTNAQGQTNYQDASGNTVAKSSVFDPLSSNYNATVANSNGKISLSDLNSANSNGLSSSYNGTNGSGGSAGNSAANGGFSGGTTGVSYPSGGTSYTPQSTSSIQDQINSLKQAQIDAAVSALGKSRDASLSNLGAESAKIEPQYYADRNTASTQSQLGAKNFAEFLAARGSTNSGVANQGQIADNVALQGQLGSLNTQEQGANNDIARRTTDVGNAYQSDVASANAGANATALQNTLNQMNMDRTFNASQAQNAFSNGIQTAGLTGNYNGQQTVAGKQADASMANLNANTIYQNLVNAGYPAEQAAKIAQAQATLTGTNLGNANQTVINNNQQKVIDSGLAQTTATIAGLDLANEYQRLVNSNYPAEQAMKMAQAASSLKGTNLANDYQTLVNAGYPSQQAADLAQKAASTAASNRSNTGGSGGGSTATATQNKAAAQAEATAQINAMIESGQTPEQMQQTITDYAATFTNAGLSPSNLKKQAYDSYEAYHASSGGHAAM